MRERFPFARLGVRHVHVMLSEELELLDVFLEIIPQPPLSFCHYVGGGSLAPGHHLVTQKRSLLQALALVTWMVETAIRGTSRVVVMGAFRRHIHVFCATAQLVSTAEVRRPRHQL